MKSQHFFQRILCGLLVLGMMVPFLTACSEPVPSENTTSEVSASTESNNTDTQQTNTDTETVEKTPPVTLHVRMVEFGIRVASVKSSNPDVADAEITKNFFTVQGYSSGTAVLEAYDYFGFKAKATVTVDTEKKEITCEVEKSTDDFIEVGLDFHAKGNGVDDDTKAFQDALDSAKPGETVYVYPGRYNVSLLTMREGVTLKMYTTMTDATQGFTDQMASDFKNNKIAILSGTRILNNKNQAPGADGCSNFSIIGGGFDENLTDRSTLIFGCAENVKLENVIFKDIKNNHVIQITGTSDMTVNNCIFAGFVCGETFTREVIQVEPSTPGATGGPLTFGEGEFNCPNNITISNCYFGDSDEAGAPLIAIGHHSRVGEANVTNFKIINNIFDECLHAAIRYNNLVNTEITGNTFISTSEYKNASQYDQAKDPSLIQLYHQSGNTSYKTEDGKTVIRAASIEQAGLHGIKIENNTFILGASSDKKILRCVMNGGVPGATYLENQLRQDTYKGEVYTLNGYRVNRDYASDLSFCNNTIRIEGQPSYKNRYISLEGVYGIRFEINSVELPEGIKFLDKTAGYGLGQVVREAQDTFVIKTAKSDRTITLICADKTYTFTAANKTTLTFNPEEGGSLSAETDKEGNLTITVVPDKGYSFDKLTALDGSVPEAETTINAPTTYTVSFRK